MFQFKLPENVLPVNLLAPAADAAGRTGGYVSLKGASKAFIVVHINQGNAATVQLSINQATAVAGTGAKAITNAVPIWSNLDAATAAAFTRRPDAVNYTTDAALKVKTVVFAIDPASLDVANGFDCIAVVTGASNAANITSAQVFLESTYGQATAVNALAD